ncbi:hypothetical protein, partial [Nitrolancea hollandica]|uniref:hypothetical protein n=1 Tax=Nitrolancea hollandica TaxID=1206749 RepID=UPI001EE6378C
RVSNFCLLQRFKTQTFSSSLLGCSVKNPNIKKVLLLNMEWKGGIKKTNLFEGLHITESYTNI